jgi:hypothetical protein
MGVTVKGDPAGVITRWKEGVKITQADATYALERQRTRILDRTARGVDVDGAPFKPYSTKGPYYYYPNGRVGTSKFSDRQNRAAASRLKRKLARGSVVSDGGVKLTRSGKGLRFDSYAAFKRWLGRSVVDLFGPRAPHMLQALVVKIGGAPVTEGRIGIYGDEAARASGHQYGTRNLPKRRFLGASTEDLKLVVADILNRIKERLSKGSNGQS